METLLAEVEQSVAAAAEYECADRADRDDHARCPDEPLGANGEQAGDRCRRDGVQ